MAQYDPSAYMNQFAPAWSGFDIGNAQGGLNQSLLDAMGSRDSLISPDGKYQLSKWTENTGSGHYEGDNWIPDIGTRYGVYHVGGGAGHQIPYFDDKGKFLKYGMSEDDGAMQNFTTALLAAISMGAYGATAGAAQGAGAGASGAGAGAGSSLASSGTGLSIGGGGTGLTASTGSGLTLGTGGGGLGITAASPGAAAFGGNLGASLAGTGSVLGGLSDVGSLSGVGGEFTGQGLSLGNSGLGMSVPFGEGLNLAGGLEGLGLTASSPGASAIGAGIGASIPDFVLPASIAGTGVGAGGATGSLSELFGKLNPSEFFKNIGPSDLISLLGGLVDAKGQGDSSDKMVNWLDENQNKMDDYMKPDSPEWKALWESMSRKDAAAGRNSQYGPRSAEFAARVADAKARNTLNFTTGNSRALAEALRQDAGKYAGLSAAAQRAAAGKGKSQSTINSIIQSLGDDVWNWITR